MARKISGLSIQDVLGILPNPTGRITIGAAAFRQIDLSTARTVDRLFLENFPFSGALVEFELSGSKWKISVPYFDPRRDSHRLRVWNAALRLAAFERNKTVVKRADGLWVLRLWIPLCRSGGAAMRLIFEEVTALDTQASTLFKAISETLPSLNLQTRLSLE